MKSDNSIIESRAVSFLKLALMTTERLKPNITENDKTPSYDGQVLVYTTRSMENKYLHGIVNVQVKGHSNNDFISAEISESVDVVKLYNYLRCGGVIYFVVRMNNGEGRIYYKILLPVDLDKLITEAGVSKTKTIKVSPIPQDDPEKLYEIFINYLYHHKLQQQPKRIIKSLDEFLQADSRGYNLTMGLGNIKIKDIGGHLAYITSHETYLYAVEPLFGSYTPIDKVKIEIAKTMRNIPIEISEDVCDCEVEFIYGKNNSRTIKIDNNIIIDIKNNNKINVTFKSSKMLQAKIKNAKVFLAILKNEMRIPGYIEKINIEKSSDTQTKIIKFEEIINELIEIQTTLRLLGITKDFDISALEEKDVPKLNMLVRAILYKEHVMLSFSGKPGFGRLTISNLNILILCSESGDNKKFNIYNMFDTDNFELLCSAENEKMEPLSPFACFLTKEMLTEYDNIDYGKIVKSIKNYKATENNNHTINNFMLELLLAYDLLEVKNDFILDAAKEIVEYLLDSRMGKRNIYIINKYQIERRRRKLLEEEVSELLIIKEKNKDCNITLGISILIENFYEAKKIFAELDEGAKNDFAKYPIMNLWKIIDENFC